MRLPLDHLGREVVGCAAVCVPHVHVCVRPAEVCELEAVWEDEEVFGFEVSVDDGRGARVQVVDGRGGLEEELVSAAYLGGACLIELFFFVEGGVEVGLGEAQLTPPSSSTR